MVDKNPTIKSSNVSHSNQAELNTNKHANDDAFSELHTEDELGRDIARRIS